MLGDQLLLFVSFLHTFGNTSENNLKYTFNHCSKLSLDLNAQTENQTFKVIHTPYRKVLLKTDCVHDHRKVQQFGGSHDNEI